MYLIKVVDVIINSSWGALGEVKKNIEIID